MPNDVGTPTDDLVRKFVHAPDDESGRALEALFKSGIEPSASAILRHKLHASLRIDDDRHVNQIGLDLLSEVKAALLPMLWRMRSQAEPAIVENFGAYVRAVALNAYRQYLRDKHPNRLRLRNKIRYILTRQPGYDVWKDRTGSWGCGLAEWKEQQTPNANSGTIEALHEALSRDADSTARLDDNGKIIRMVELIFERSMAPIAFEDFVSMIWDSLGLRELQNISAADGVLDAVSSKDQNIEQCLDDRFALERLWEKVCTMPLRHRRALLLNLSDGRGDNLIALLPMIGIASIRRIAAVLEYEPEEFAKLWNELPLDDLAIAKRLGLTRQQVINLRQSARASLRRRSL